MSRTWPSLIRRSDHGAVTALVAVVVGCGVLMGVSAMVVDVGRLYAEREQLQSGADAAARAAAEKCALMSSCQSAATTMAARYADSNAEDGTSSVYVCGSGAGLPLCTAPSTNLTRCIGDEPTSTKYVEVRTTTRLGDGSTLLPPTFAQAMLGNDGYEGTRVGACARAAWGPPRAATAAAFTFSRCEWNLYTNNGTSFQPAPGQGTPSEDIALNMHDNKGNPACPQGPSGWDRPGGFGWLDETAGACKASVAADGTYGGDTGNSVSQGCRSVLPTWRSSETVLLLPIYDTVTGNGSNITYRLAGFAPFVMTGYFLSGFTAESTLTGGHQCKDSDRCIYGYFVKTLLATTGEIGGPDFGGIIVSLVG